MSTRLIYTMHRFILHPLVTYGHLSMYCNFLKANLQRCIPGKVKGLRENIRWIRGLGFLKDRLHKSSKHTFTAFNNKSVSITTLIF